MLKVDIENITFKENDSTKVILKDIHFELNENDILTILGKNGAGKSTLIYSLTSLLNSRFYDVQGNVLFNGKDILKLEEDELSSLRKNKIRYVFQDAVNTFDHLRNFKYHFGKLKAVKEEIDEILSYFLLPAKEKLFEMYPYEVSGGMAQRISLVLSLLAKPELLILDEPTSAVDAPIANLMGIKLKEYLSQNVCSILIITQDYNFALHNSHRIAYLGNGTLTKTFNVSSLINKKENISNYEIIEQIRGSVV